MYYKYHKYKCALSIDTNNSITTAAQIDIRKNRFNYKEHRKNAYKLLMILLSTVILMFIILYSFYDLDMRLTWIYLSFELVNFAIYPIYRIKTCYLQLEYSALKITTNKIIASGLRFAISLLPTPFCTGIGQVSSSIYQFISIKFLFNRNYKLEKDGSIIRQERDGECNPQPQGKQMRQQERTE